MTGGEEESVYHKERNIRAKDSLFVLDCRVVSLLAMTLAVGEKRVP
jgi:hypothetical protein